MNWLIKNIRLSLMDSLEIRRALEKIPKRRFSLNLRILVSKIGDKGVELSRRWVDFFAYYTLVIIGFFQ